MGTSHRGFAIQRLTSAVLAIAATAGLGACTTSGNAAGGSGGSRTIRVDGLSIALSGSPRVAFFAPFLGNAAIQLVRRTVEAEVAGVPGATVEVFDANGNAATQVNQIQNAIQSRRFNIAFVIAADPVLECRAITKDMPKAGILVGIFNTPMCDTWDQEGDKLRAPGTFAFVGGTHTIGYYYDYFSWIARQNPDPQQVLVITAPQLNAITKAIERAVERVEAEHPGFEVVDTAYTDYSVPMSFARTQTMIQAHPDATILYTGYSTAAQGAVTALQAAGRLDRIKIYDKGGSRWAAEAVRAGTIQATTPEAQATSAKALVRLLIDALNGTATTPTVLLHDAIDLLPGATATGFEAFTQDNIHLWQPEVS